MHRSKHTDIAATVASIMDGARARFGHGEYRMDGNAVLDRLRDERQRQFDFIDQLTERIETESRDMVDAERQNVEAAHARVGELDAQIAPLEQFEQLRGAHRQGADQFRATGNRDRGDQGGEQGGERRGLGLQVNEREHEYRTVGEYLADIYRASGAGERNPSIQRSLNAEVKTRAASRLQTHGVTVDERGMVTRAAAPHNTTTEVPGLLPTTIVGQIMSDVDAARPFISSIGAKDLGGIPGTSFERPTITSHVKVDKQSAEKTEVANRQFKVGSVPFTKDTYGGWANVSRQSIDWTSPGVWDALMTDFIEQYGIETENAAADAFATAVTQDTDTVAAVPANPTLTELLTALYSAAGKSYQGSGRMPDRIWVSLDWWAKLGVLIDHLKATTAGDGGGDSAVTSFAGNLLRTPRIVVPSFAAGTLIVGVANRTEVYEDRFGFLSAVEPKVFGVELAYGGYMASGTIKPLAFTKVNFQSA
jgi:hypothetical protein